MLRFSLRPTVLRACCKQYSKMAASDLRAGLILAGSSVPGQPADRLLSVESFVKGKAGKGGGYVQVKFRDFLQSKTVTHKFASDAKVEVLELDNPQTFTFLYEDGDLLHLMDSSGEQIEVPVDVFGERNLPWLQDGMDIRIQNYEGRPLSAKLPHEASYAVAEAGQKSGDLRKVVALENGHKLKVPSNVEAGQRVVVNLEEFEYIRRATE